MEVIIPIVLAFLGGGGLAHLLTARSKNRVDTAAAADTLTKASLLLIAQYEKRIRELEEQVIRLEEKVSVLEAK